MNRNKSNKDAERMKLYRAHRNKVGEEILRAVLRALASADANEMLTEILQVNLKLTGVVLDKKEFDRNIMNVLRGEIASILIGNSSLSDKDRERLRRRVIAQIAPMRDNILPLMPSVPNRRRTEGIEDAIKEELARLEKSR